MRCFQLRHVACDLVIHPPCVVYGRLLKNLHFFPIFRRIYSFEFVLKTIHGNENDFITPQQVKVHPGLNLRGRTAVSLLEVDHVCDLLGNPGDLGALE